MSKADLNRIADGFRYVAQDPTTDRATVVKMVHEFCNAASSRMPTFVRGQFLEAVFGAGQKVMA